MADLVLGTDRLGWRGAAWGRWPAALAVRLDAERERWALWLPVGLGTGIGLYFALPFEPSGPVGPALAVLLLATAVCARRSTRRRAALLLAVTLPLGVVAAGFALAQLQAWRVAAPALSHPLGIVPVAGRVADVEARPEGMRVTLAPEMIGGLERSALPPLIRLKLRRPMALSIGDRLAIRAALLPPPGPALPGGFDFQRQAWFRGLGAVGYSVGDGVVTPQAPDGLGGRLRALRAAMTARIQAALPSGQGGIAAALITGERGAVPAQVNQDYRDAGLAHLLVIAGLHMTLVTGFVFFATRAVLALVPALALNYPIKKWAALAALLVAALYLVISGAAVPTQRAFVMVAVGLLAVLIDRLHLSMSGVAWAAGIVLALDPQAMTGVSFQMSFAAVVGLIAFYESFGPRLAERRAGRGPLGRFLLHLVGIALTTIVATVATAAFSIYHFNRFALFSVLANVIAVPIAGCWVMPWAFASCLLMPFGLEGWGLRPMGWGLDAIEAVARWTAGLPYAVIDLPAMPGWGLVAIAAGGLWLALWRTRWRLWGLAGIAAGAGSLILVTPPDIIVASDGRLVAFRVAGHYLLSSPTADRTEAEDWLRATGAGSSGAMPTPGHAIDGLRCDSLGCVWQVDGVLVAFDRDPAALPEDCRRARLVIAFTTVPRACRLGKQVIDHAFIRRNGATTVRLADGIRIETANAVRGRRPWVPATRNSGIDEAPGAIGAYE